MPISVIKKEIDGHAVEIQQFMAIKGIKIKVKLLKTILPVISTLFIGGGKKDVKSLLDKEIDSKMIETIMLALDPEEICNLLLELLSSSFVDAKLIDAKTFDDFFAANYMLAYKIAVEVVKANNFLALSDIGISLEKK